MAKRWTKKDTTYLKRYAKIRLLGELAERFRATPEEVETKLKELQLASKDGRGHVPKRVDPLVRVYERGVKALHQGKWREAVKHLDRVAEESTQTDLVGQARRLARVCRGKLGESSEVRDDDPFLLAVYERNRGNLEQALAICSRGGRQSKDERFAYLAASIHSLMGDQEKAARFLQQAIELNPKNRIHAFHDADFEDLRTDPEYRELFF